MQRLEKEYSNDHFMNKITIITRQRIADEITLRNLSISGRMDDADFLNRTFDLKALPSDDPRYKDAFGDIKNDCRWGDNEPGWMFKDARFNLLHCQDEIFLKVLSDSLHPMVYNNSLAVSELVDIYNKLLNADGFEVYISDSISNLPVYAIREITLSSQLANNKEIIKTYLNSDYIRAKTKIMVNSLPNNTDLAIGTAKELIETVCKSILTAKGVSIPKEWDFPRLFKEMASRVVSLEIKDVENPEVAKKSLQQVLGGLNSIIHGVAELRNSYGSGHGKDVDFKGLPSGYANFIVSVVSDIAVFVLNLNGEKTELVE